MCLMLCTVPLQAHIMYQRDVNPNRVMLATALQYEGSSGNSKFNVAAEYALKQSKVCIGCDSDLTMHSTVESNIAEGVQLSLSCELPQLQQEACKFGIGLMMG